MQDWKELYLELAEKINEIDGIKWIDLWHNQINFLEEEHPFPAPAVFISFRSQNIEDLSERIQKVGLQVEVYLFYETFADTYKDSVNQDSALAFIDLMGGIYAKLQGTSGDSYNSMRRVGFSPVDTGGAGNLYQMIFECELVDLSAKVAYEEAETTELDIERHPQPVPTVTNDNPMFQIPD